MTKATREQRLRRVREALSYGLSNKIIADMLGMSYRSVRVYLYRHGLKANNDRNMDKNANWRGGRRVKKDGYVMIYCPQHHLANKRGEVGEHRIVMEAKLGRKLKRGEVVHHIDHDRANNVQENLQLFASQKQHCYFHSNLDRHPAGIRAQQEDVGF